MIPASRVVQPSLFLLLVVIASILLAYGSTLDSPADRFAGIAVALGAIIILHPIVQKTIARKEERPYRDTPGPILPAWGETETPNTPHSPLRVRLLAVLALACAAVTAYRINALARPDAESTALTSFAGTVESARMQRYTSEIVIRLDHVPGTRDRAAEISRAVVLAPRDTTVRRGDECAVFSEARPITMERIRESSFLRGLARRGLAYVAYADEDSLAVVKTTPDGARETIRSGIARSIDLHFSAGTASLLKALYFGNKNHLDKRTIEYYKKAGVMHILAASGLHVGIVAAIPFMLLAPLRIGKMTILAVTTALLCFYLYITDMPVSLVRAFMMFAAYAVQRLFDMDRGAVNTLFLTASAILIFMPHELYEPGFQLTFGATLGILLFYRSFDACLDLLPRPLRGPLALTLAAQIPVFPIILYHMNEINLAGVVSNLVAVPGVAFALSASIAAQCAGLLSETAARVLAVPVDMAVEATSLFVRAMASLGGHFRMEHRWWVLLPFFALYIAPLFAKRKNRHAAAIALPLAFAGAWFMLSSDAGRPVAPRVVYEEAGRTIVVSDGRHALLYGRLTGIEEARAVYEILERERVETVQLALAETDFRSLSASCFLARRCVVSACIIDSGFRFSRALSRLVAVLERDGVTPEFRRLRPPPVHCGDAMRCTDLFSPPTRVSPMSTLAAAMERLRAYFRSDGDLADIARPGLPATPERR
ncbi:MAG TPA: ComEC/Rec2 family competence protein [Spirochaetota bacterium]|nr:ComEC/Rec2 family competence protein [Spirochaetota bacterium]